MLRIWFAIAAIAAALAAATPPAAAQAYYLNGLAASNAQAQYLALHGIPYGSYRVDTAGNIALAAPGYNRRTPFGDMMSDGKCALVQGVPVGSC
jgi:hypothetical protein